MVGLFVDAIAAQVGRDEIGTVTSCQNYNTLRS